ncbi:hypothetical protein VP01_691g1 [Puccinia sorghi]|uniref:Uncharacterized protein n=1 Tax=Puccinia sorghi TaxID=27349 RepID=A0A0L6UEZ3_9BASI|nr:hypothetical protein VP01_691g1 [Puccinia sorghi]
MGLTKPMEKKSEDQSDSAATLIHKSKKGKNKGKHGPYCAPGKHNPEATSHNADHLNGSQPTTQLIEVNDGNKSEVSLLLNEAASKPTVLESGATHHLINNPDTFMPTAESNIKIATGGQQLSQRYRRWCS